VRHSNDLRENIKMRETGLPLRVHYLREDIIIPDGQLGCVCWGGSLNSIGGKNDIVH
jgi:hypothetical protein